MTRWYLVIVEEAPHNFAAYSPDLPGCVATGDTKDATLANMRDAIAFHIEGLVEEGVAVPKAASSAEYIAV